MSTKHESASTAFKYFSEAQAAWEEVLEARRAVRLAQDALQTIRVLISEPNVRGTRCVQIAAVIDVVLNGDDHGG